MNIDEQHIEHSGFQCEIVGCHLNVPSPVHCWFVLLRRIYTRAGYVRRNIPTPGTMAAAHEFVELHSWMYLGGLVVHLREKVDNDRLKKGISMI